MTCTLDYKKMLVFVELCDRNVGYVSREPQCFVVTPRLPSDWWMQSWIRDDCSLDRTAKGAMAISCTSPMWEIGVYPFWKMSEDFLRQKITGNLYRMKFVVDMLKCQARSDYFSIRVCHFVIIRAALSHSKGVVHIRLESFRCLGLVVLSSIKSGARNESFWFSSVVS